MYCTCDGAFMHVTIQHQVCITIKAVLSIEVDLAESGLIRKVFIKSERQRRFSANSARR
jgi:hypothetical protein